AQKMLESAQLQLNNTQQQLEFEKEQREMQLLQRAVSEITDYLKIFVDQPALRPYFYDNRERQPNDTVSDEAIKTMAELILNNYACAGLHSAKFPQYGFKLVEEAIKFHLHNSPALRNFLLTNLNRYPFTGLTLLCLKNDSQTGIEQDLSTVIRNAKDRDER